MVSRQRSEGWAEMLDSARMEKTVRPQARPPMEVLALSFQLMGSTVICVPVLGMILEKGCPTALEELWLESQEAWVASLPVHQGDASFLHWDFVRG